MPLSHRFALADEPQPQEAASPNEPKSTAEAASGEPPSAAPGDYPDEPPADASDNAPNEPKKVSAIASKPLRQADQPAARVPVALCWRADGRLLVALRDSRELVAIDPTSWTKTETVSLPFHPNSLVSLSESDAVVVGGSDGELLRWSKTESRLLRDRQGRGAVSLAALDGRRLAVASTWGQAVDVIDSETGRWIQTEALSFPPGRLVRRSPSRLLVLDAFGSQIADVDFETGRVRTRPIEGVNLRAAALSGDGRELLVGHMSQYREVPLTSTNLDWGLVISSGLSAVPLSEFDPLDFVEGKILKRRKITLDGSAHGAADPSAMAISGDGKLVLLALSGAHQVLKNDRTLGATSTGDAEGLLPIGHNQKLETLEVGRSPVALVLDRTSEFAITADSMSDTLTVVRVAGLEVVKTIQLGSEKDVPTDQQRGEAIFLDGRRALDRWMTCVTCHPGGHTNGLNFDTLGDDAYGAAKNTHSLLGVGQSAPYSWIGKFPELSQQVHQSLRTSLRGPSPNDSVANDLVAYLESLVPPPAKRPGDDPSAVRGSALFQNRQCSACHKASTFFTSTGVKNVGLDDGVGGHKAFNPPSLRGVGWSAPYFHDGRAKTLGDVLDIHPESAKRNPLTPEERTDLTAYLESL